MLMGNLSLYKRLDVEINGMLLMSYLWKLLQQKIYVLDSCVIECTDAYFPFIRELRSSTNKEIRVMKEFPDVDKRIAATSDYVKNSILFSASKVESDTEYVAFMNNLMDYNKDSETKEASAVLSGLVQFVVKLGLN